jgi:hypothetical protein
MQYLYTDQALARIGAGFNTPRYPRYLWAESCVRGTLTIAASWHRLVVFHRRGFSLQEGESVTGKRHSECTGKNGTRQSHMMRQSFSEARKQVKRAMDAQGNAFGVLH